MIQWKRIASKATVCLLLALVLGCSSSRASRSPGTANSDRARSNEEDSAPANFKLTTLSGQSISLSEYLGKNVILLDFWATYCAPCLVAMPHLNDLYKKYEGQGLVVLGVSVDEPDSRDEVRALVEQLKIEFPVLLDEDAKVLGLYNKNSSAPYSVLIDRKGLIVMKKEGFDVAALDVFEEDIVRALAIGVE